MMPEHETGYFGRLLAALLGRDAAGQAARPAPASAPVSAPVTGDVLTLQSAAARLQMDLTERNERIAKLQEEYRRLEVARDEAQATAGSEELDRFFDKASKPLANLAALADAAEQGQEVVAHDLLQLAAGIMKVFDRSGLHRIGKLGEETVFDSAIHRRMSGGEVDEGVRVTVCVPGYRTERKIMLKAMVRSMEAK